MSDIDYYGEDEDEFGPDDFDGDEFEDEGFEEFEDFDSEGLEYMADAAMDDPDAEDEFLGALAGLAASALPALAKHVVPGVLKIGKRLLRGGSRRVARRLPTIVRTATRVLAQNPGAVQRNPARVQRVLHRCARRYARRGRYGRMRRYG